MKFFRYGLAIALVAVIAITVVGCSKSGGGNGKIAATVNGKDITIAEVDKQLSQMVGNNMQMFSGPQGQAMKENYRIKILDQLIDMQLLLDEADKRGLKVSDKDLDAKIKELMKQYGIKNQAELEKALSQQGVTFVTFKEELKKRMLIEKLGDDLTKNLKASDKDIEKYYNEHKGEFATKDQVYVQHILVGKEDQANNILKELKKGANFADLAKKYSTDPGSKDKGGELPWMDKDKYVPEFAAASWALEPGQITEKPVKTQYGYHIIKLIDKKSGKQKTLKESLKEIKDKLLASKKQEIFNNWLEKARKNAKITKYLTPPTTDPTYALPPGAIEGANQQTQQQQTQQQQGGAQTSPHGSGTTQGDVPKANQ